MGSVSSADRAFEALADPYRRRLLLAVLEANDQGRHAPLALFDGAVADDPAEVRTRLHHVHLPKLADAGFIEWDREADTLSTGPRWHELAPLLRLLEEHREELPAALLAGPAADA